MAKLVRRCEISGCTNVPEWIIKSRKYPENRRLQHVTCNEHLGQVCRTLMSDATTPYDICSMMEAGLLEESHEA